MGLQVVEGADIMTGERMKAAAKGLDRRNKFYTVEEAVKAIKDRAKAKFDETIEVAMNLGIDPKHADQNVRGVVSLPNGTGKTVRVAVFAKGDKAEAAKKAEVPTWSHRRSGREGQCRTDRFRPRHRHPDMMRWSASWVRSPVRAA